MQFFQKDCMTLALFKTKVVLSVLSTCKSHKKIINDIQIEDSGEEQKEKIPEEWALYRQHMGGVDIANQLVAYYTTKRKSNASWLPIFFWALDICIINAYYLYKHSTPHPLSRLDFRKKLVDELLQISEEDSKKRDRDEEKKDQEGHYFGSLGTVGECNICSSRNKDDYHRKETRKGCKVCNIHFCSIHCYNQSHS